MSVEQLYNCIFCNETFDDKEALRIHFRKHGDPKFKPQNELQINEKPIEDLDMVSCDVCTEKFPTISKAITHKHKVHPEHDAKYFCAWCGKLFTMKHLYKKHYFENHENDERVMEGKTLHCDSCDVDFFLPSAMLHHNKFFHRQDVDIPTIGQSKKFHFYNQEPLPIFYCAFCGEEYNNKVNLHKHITDDHNDEDQNPDDVLRCPLCDAVFYHLDAYELHLTFHSMEDLYNERTEMINETTDFSLESVPPITEKVKNKSMLETDNEGQRDVMGIDQFLQLAMDDSNDTLSKKSKKRKKHKKSKKAAITLDEFLNMNTDVFGEGLDFQGIEEVPTPVVKKRKVNKKQQQTQFKNELEKLKSQGIVIKKGKNIPGLKSKKTETGINTKPIKVSQNCDSNEKGVTPKITVLNTSNEVLSKLINQSNNQIKIMKKSTADVIDKALVDQSTTRVSVKLSSDYSESEELDFDELNPQKHAKNEKESDIDSSNKMFTDDFELSKDENKSQSDHNPIKNENNFNKVTSSIISTSFDDTQHEDKFNPTNPVKQIEEMENTNVNKNENYTQKSDKSKIEPSTIHALKNIAHHVTVKPTQASSNTNFIQNASHEIGSNSNRDEKSEQHGGSTSKSLDALKHLSHLITIKPVSSSKSACVDHKDDKISTIKSFIGTSLKSEREDDDEINSVCQETKLQTFPQKEISSGLKNVGQNVTIKSLSAKASDSDFLDNLHFDESNRDDVNDGDSDNTNSKKIQAINTSLNLKTDNSSRCSQISNCEINRPIPVMKQQSNSDKKSNNPKSVHLLQRLKNITAKSLTSNINQKTDDAEIIPKVKVSQKYNEVDDDIEIYNIDDSDDDIDIDISSKLTDTASAVKSSTQSANSLKYLGKHISVNSNASKPYTNAHVTDEQDNNGSNKFEPVQSDDSDAHSEINKSTKLNERTPCNQKSMALKQVLKHLGKHITVKSRNSSPSISIKSQNSNFEGHDDSDDSDSCSGKVKITEINTDEYEQINTQDRNVIIESPHDSPSEHEDNEFDELSDIESQIKVNTLEKHPPDTKLQSSLNNLNNITVKSLQDQKIAKDIVKPELKPQQINRNIHREVVIKPSNRNVGHITGESNNKSNHLNTNNKEVAVKTYQTQTKTVIQEITTTVTKTIKTVSHTKQEVQNTKQMNSGSLTPQKVQGPKPNQLSKNLQGMVVKQAPILGPRISNANAQIRPQSSMQLVPVRPSANVARLSKPRMPGIRKSTPSITSQPNQSGKSIKISPGAMSPTVKRSNTDESAGHFSCFKKPKESLIPVSDIPSFNSSEGESRVQVSSVSHTSHSNFTSATKIVKGNSVVMSTQMKSEVRSQHLNKLSNVSGLQVAKTSQAQVQEKSETSFAKRTTLEAIEKLQKQGLLVKKPKLDTNDFNDNSNPDDNDHYSSDDNCG